MGILLLGAVLEQFFAKYASHQFLHRNGRQIDRAGRDHSMASPDRTQAHCSLFEALQRKPYAFHFFQALRRLNVCTAKPRLGKATRLSDDPVRLAQEPSLAFAPATLAAFDPGGDDRPPRLFEYFRGFIWPGTGRCHPSDRIRATGRAMATTGPSPGLPISFTTGCCACFTEPGRILSRPSLRPAGKPSMCMSVPCAVWACRRCGIGTRCRIWPSFITPAAGQPDS